jgi:hypothetical protein
LFVRGEDQTSGGTAFFVSPTVLVTANHVCVPGQKYIALMESAPSLSHFEEFNTDALILLEELGFGIPYPHFNFYFYSYYFHVFELMIVMKRNMLIIKMQAV